jgi:phosphatidylinositol-3-phosphatase
MRASEVRVSVLRILVSVLILGAAAVTADPARAATGTVTKVLVFIEENHSMSEMKSGMPYLHSQAVKYGYASHYTAVAHPSLPNYLAIVGGSTFGVTTDGNPSRFPEHTPDVYGTAITAGRTARVYAESMPANCDKTSSGSYAARHNPWVYFPAEAARCAANDVPSGTTSSGELRRAIVNGSLPTLGWVTPNVQHDGHDGTLATADAWLKKWLVLVYASADWKAGRLAVIVTADEDDYSQHNTVLTVVLHPSQAGHVVSTALNHYSLTGLLTRVAHAPCVRKGCGAANFAAAFGLKIG